MTALDSPQPELAWTIWPKDNERRDATAPWPQAPKWRKHHSHPFDLLLETTEEADQRGKDYRDHPSIERLINAAIHLRRPLLVTGEPGSGKSSLAYAIAWRLRLGPALVWPINTRSTLQQGLYTYDAIGRLNESSILGTSPDKVIPQIDKFLLLGPLGTALLPWKRPRVLLIDEIDKSDIDLPNDLLNVLEEGEFDLPELQRIAKPEERKVRAPGLPEAVPLPSGKIQCNEFPVVVLTSNGEREFPPAFLRRCIQLKMPPLESSRLADIVEARLGGEYVEDARKLFEKLSKSSHSGIVATDQFLNALWAVSGRANMTDEERSAVVDLLLAPLGERVSG